MKKNWKTRAGLFLSSQAISLFGSSLVQYAILWHITLETKSGSMMMISVIFGFLPTFFLAPFAGVWADRFNRKLLIVLSDSIIAIATLVLAILFWAGHDYIWLLFLISAIRAMGAGIQNPAVSALIPQLVPRKKLTKINGINNTIMGINNLASPMLAGAVLSLARIEAIFMIDVITAAIAVTTLLFFLKVPPHKKAAEKQELSYFADLKAGLSYIKNHSYLRNFFIFCAVFFFFIAPGALLTPLQVARTYGDEVWMLTAIEIAFSIGMMIGGLAITFWGGFRNRIHTMALAIFVMGASVFCLGLGPWFWVYLSIMFVYGISMPIYHTPTAVLLQEQVEESFHGRVFGVLSMISSSVVPLSMLIFGPISDVVKLEHIFLITGTSITIIGIFFVRNKPLLDHGVPK